MPIRGISGIGNINSITDYNKVEPYVVFWRFRWDWADINPSFGVYNYTDEEADVDIVVADGKFFSFQISVSPVTIAPAWIFLPPYNVPKVTGAGGQIYPYYLNATFISLKQAMLDNLRTRIKNTWSVGRKAKLVMWQSTEGKTGDEGTGIESVTQVTINGVVQPNPSAYSITKDQWTNHKRTSIWTQFQAALIADISTCLLAINPSNDATDWEWALANLQNVVLKGGQVSHNYQNLGEYFYALRGNALTSVVPNNMFFGEFENVDDLPDFQAAPKQNMFALLCSFMAHGGTSLNISVGTFQNVIDIDDPDDWWMFEFANEVMGMRNAEDENKAWIAFRDVVDLTDARFPENIYGQLVPVSQWNQYNNKYQTIFNSSDTQSVKNDKYVSLLLQYYNDARRVSIIPTVPNLNLEVLDGSNDHDMYNQDCIIYGFTNGNYSKFMTQYNPNNTSIGHARIGNPATETHGRFCRAPNNEISVIMDSSLMSDASHTVTVDIYYYNESGRTWSFNYYNASFLVKTAYEIVTNTGTNTWLKKSYTIPNMLTGGYLSNGTDWTLKTESGSGTKFGMVYFSSITQNASIIPVGGSKSNTQSDICGLLSEPFYTQGAFGIGKIVYTDPEISTALTGYLFFLENNTGTIYNLNSATGQVLSVTGNSCGVGTQGVYVLGNTLGIICGGNEAILYTNGAFGVGKVLAYNSNLFTVVTGYVYVVDTATNIIYNLNSVSGVVGTTTGSSCSGSGIAGLYKTGSVLAAICSLSNTTLYTNGQFGVGSTLFTDINLITQAIGFSYVVVSSTNFIYSVNSGNGLVGAKVGVCNGGVSGSFKLSNSSLTVCQQSTTTLYTTTGEPFIGTILYTNSNITTRLTGYQYAVDTATDAIYFLNSLTGEILAQTGSCNAGVARTVRLGNTLTGVCALSTTTVYTENPFATGETLFYDISLTNLIRYYDYVVDTNTNIVYNLDNNTGVVGNATSIICGSGIAGSYKLGNNILTICGATAVTLYTNGAFAIGKTLYEDINLITVLATPYAYIVDASTGYIYEMYNSVVGDITTGICGGGIEGQYRVSNVATAVCVSGTLVTLYTPTAFAVGVFLSTDEDLLIPFIGYTYIVNPANDYIYIVDDETGEILSQTNNACSASDYLQNLPDEFSINAAKYIKDCGCEPECNE